MRTTLDQGLRRMSVAGLPDILDTEREQLITFVALLAKWNKIYNLTAVREPVQMVERHLLDSLVMCRWLPLETRVGESACAFDVMDIGTGAGLPVLPLAVVRPDLQFLSVESNGKKTRFQQQVVLELGLRNVTVRHERIETVSQQAQMVMSRAFTAPAEFLEIAQTLCIPKGVVAVMLGHAERLPGELGPEYELMKLLEVHIPGIESARHVALCRRQPG